MKRITCCILVLLLTLTCLVPAALAEEWLSFGIVMQKETAPSWT